MNVRAASPKSGIALIMVLVVIVVLSVLAFGFAYSMKVEMTLARHASFSTELDWAGRAGIEVAKWVLAEESKGPNAMMDSLKCKWAGGPGETNSPLVDIDLKNYPLGNAMLSIDIKDLDRKFNINMADEVILKQALTLVGVDAGAFTTIASSILDWRDPNRDPHMGGAESEFYEGLPIPYKAKDGPIDDISELLLIKGVTPAMYWGSSFGSGRAAVLNRPDGIRGSQFDEPTYAVGLVELFTPLSSRLMNANTASRTQLQVIPEIDEPMADAIIAARAGPDGQDGTEDDTPFRSPQELMRVPMLGGGGGGLPGAGPGAGAPGPGGGAMGQMTRYFTVRSLVFEVHVVVSIASTKREYIAILRRNNPKDIQTLNVYWKQPN